MLTMDIEEKLREYRLQKARTHDNQTNEEHKSKSPLLLQNFWTTAGNYVSGFFTIIGVSNT